MISSAPYFEGLAAHSDTRVTLHLDTFHFAPYFEGLAAQSET